MDGAQHGQAGAVERGVVGVSEDDPQRHREGVESPSTMKRPICAIRSPISAAPSTGSGMELDLRQVDWPALPLGASFITAAPTRNLHVEELEPHAERFGRSLALLPVGDRAERGQAGELQLDGIGGVDVARIEIVHCA